MTIRVKPGVTWVYAPALFRILEGVKAVSQSLGVTCTITSAADGKHSGPTDPHYSGNAIDLRAHDLTREQLDTVLAGLRAELGPQFSVLDEGIGTANHHVHIQRTSGTTYGMSEYLAS